MSDLVYNAFEKRVAEQASSLQTLLLQAAAVVLNLRIWLEEHWDDSNWDDSDDCSSIPYVSFSWRPGLFPPGYLIIEIDDVVVWDDENDSAGMDDPVPTFEYCRDQYLKQIRQHLRFAGDVEDLDRRETETLETAARAGDTEQSKCQEPAMPPSET